jgi:glycosyltransferase involved in cell wall biosynthesis
MKLSIDWGVSSYYGWGVYGLNLALECAKDESIELYSEAPLKPDDIVVDPLRKRALVPFIKRSSVDGGKPLVGARLHALGNDILPESTKRIGVIFFEAPLSRAGIERAKRYDLIIVGSTWNADILRAAGLDNVRTILQGVDSTLFHPAPKRGLFPGKFLIFSGGKAEPRKGQDIVVKAFRIFAAKHKEAMLVTAWHSPWPHLAVGMDLDLSEFGDRVVDVGALPNGQMASVYRECDVALFPNRAEGGTNLVAMETIACGVRTIVSANTGHLDLTNRNAVCPLRRQKPCAEWSEWGESDVDEIVTELEHSMAAAVGHPYATLDLTWAKTTDSLLSAVNEVGSHGAPTRK